MFAYKTLSPFYEELLSNHVQRWCISCVCLQNRLDWMTEAEIARGENRCFPTKSVNHVFLLNNSFLDPNAWFRELKARLCKGVRYDNIACISGTENVLRQKFCRVLLDFRFCLQFLFPWMLTSPRFSLFRTV